MGVVALLFLLLFLLCSTFVPFLVLQSSHWVREEWFRNLCGLLNAMFSLSFLASSSRCRGFVCSVGFPGHTHYFHFKSFLREYVSKYSLSLAFSVVGFHQLSSKKTEVIYQGRHIYCFPRTFTCISIRQSVVLSKIVRTLEFEYRLGYFDVISYICKAL